MSLNDTLTAVTSEPPEQTLSEEDVFTLLSNRRRRFVIHALKQSNGDIEIADLAEQVTAWERDLDPEDVDYKDRRNVQTTLKRTHLPTLAEAGVIRFVDDHTVEPTATLAEVDVYVEVLTGHEIPWSLYYTGLSGLSLLLLLANVGGMPMINAFSPIDIALFTVVVFAVSAVAHHIIGKRMQLGSDNLPPELEQR